MFEVLPQSGGKVIGIRAAGKLTDADYKDLVPRLEKLIAEHGPIRLLVDLGDFEGWELAAAWDDFVFGLKHWNDFERMALVGNKTWEKLAAKAMAPLMKGEVRYFDSAEADDAWAWVRG